jgi:hypothetical protein
MEREEKVGVGRREQGKGGERGEGRGVRGRARREGDLHTKSQTSKSGSGSENGYKHCGDEDK